MGKFSSMINGISESFSIKRGEKNIVNDVSKEVSKSMIREAKKNEMLLSSCGIVNAKGSNNFTSLYSKKGNKGVNQDSFLVWEEFGCQKDVLFCGVFDGHGSWGHFVSKWIRDSMAMTLLCNWQETLALASNDPKCEQFNIWKDSYSKTCSAIDQELERHCVIDSFNSGTTALTIVRQGDTMYISNVGDSRAVLATTSDEGTLLPIQLTTDFKPHLPEERERITRCNGRVISLDDERGLYRVWLPVEDTPGLAMSRAFGDFCVKDFGVVSVPEVTQRSISTRDQFVILATDGVWDVLSNEEAVEIVYSTPLRAKAAKRLVECARRAWKRKRWSVGVDDISAICLFFHTSTTSQKIDSL